MVACLQAIVTFRRSQGRADATGHPECDVFFVFRATAYPLYLIFYSISPFHSSGSSRK